MFASFSFLPDKYAKPHDMSGLKKEDTPDVRPQIDPSSLATADRREPQVNYITRTHSFCSVWVVWLLKRPSKDGNVSRLVEMGFDHDDSVRALQKSRGDPETAIDMLTGCTPMEGRKQRPDSAKTFGPRKERGVVTLYQSCCSFVC